METYRFSSAYHVGDSLGDFSEKVVKDEPMFFSATPRFAYDKGGIITRTFLRTALAELGTQWCFDEQNKGLCFDSRVHMLMPGWFPCIPGWHHDDVPRSRFDGQPNYDTPEFSSKHCLALINGDICPTEFAVGKAEYPKIEQDQGNVYEVWHDITEAHIRAGRLARESVPTNRLIWFNNHSFHQGTRAVKRGWRWFGRLSWDAGYEDGRPHANEIRRQVNVYMDTPFKGW